MVTKNDYPLKDVLTVKIKRVEKAEEVLKQKKEELRKEQERLKKAEEERDKVANHLKDKVNQLREAFDRGTNSDEVLMMKRYIKVVEEKLKVEQEKVKKQKERVELAEKNVQIAKEELRLRNLEVDKLNMHREEWLKMALKEEEFELAKQQDEIGNVLFLAHRRKKS